MATNAEKLRAKRERDPEAWNASRRAWYNGNLEKARASRREWYARNKDRLKEQFKEVWKAKDTRRRADGRVKAADIRDILRLQKHRCAVCGCSVRDGYHVDHIAPLAGGGANDRRNLQILCPPCNMSKGAKDPASFMRSRGFLL